MRRRLGRIAACAVTAGFAALASGQEAKIATFDFDRVSKETQEGQRLQKQLKDFQEKKQADLAVKEKDLKALQDQLQAQALSLSPERRSAMEKDLQRKQNELQGAREGAQREWQIEFNEARERFQQTVVGAVEQVGREGKCTIILESGQVAFRSDASDITSQIIQRINTLAPSGTAEPPGKAPPAPPGAAAPGGSNRGK